MAYRKSRIKFGIVIRVSSCLWLLESFVMLAVGWSAGLWHRCIDAAERAAAGGSIVAVREDHVTARGIDEKDEQDNGHNNEADGLKTVVLAMVDDSPKFHEKEAAALGMNL